MMIATRLPSRALAGRSSSSIPGVPTRPGARRTLLTVSSSSRDEAVKQLESYTAQMRGTLTSDSSVPVDTSAPAPPAAAPDGGLLELNKDTFYDYLGAQGDTLVVVDFFTDWCGPCKLIYPELVKLAASNPDIRIVKFNCNKANKDLGQKLAIKVAPTFHLYRSSVKVAEMTGAKVDKLVELINQHRK